MEEFAFACPARGERDPRKPAARDANPTACRFRASVGRHLVGQGGVSIPIPAAANEFRGQKIDRAVEVIGHGAVLTPLGMRLLGPPMDEAPIRLDGHQPRRMAVEPRHADDGFGNARFCEAHAGRDIFSIDQGRCRLKQHDMRRVIASRFHLLQRMLDDGQMRGIVGRELSRPEKRDFRAGLPRRRGDRRIIGRKNEPLDRAAAYCFLNRPSDERLAAYRRNVLARQALRSAPRGDNAEHAARRISPSVGFFHRLRHHFDKSSIVIQCQGSMIGPVNCIPCATRVASQAAGKAFAVSARCSGMKSRSNSICQP